MSLPITAEYIYEVPAVSQPSLSDDGGALAFVKTMIDREKMSANRESSFRTIRLKNFPI